MFNGPELSCSVDPHLDLVINEQNSPLLEDFLQFFKITLWGNDITPRPLDGFYEKSRILRIFTFVSMTE